MSNLIVHHGQYPSNPARSDQVRLEARLCFTEEHPRSASHPTLLPRARRCACSFRYTGSYHQCSGPDKLCYFLLYGRSTQPSGPIARHPYSKAYILRTLEEWRHISPNALTCRHSPGNVRQPPKLDRRPFSHYSPLCTSLIDGVRETS